MALLGIFFAMAATRRRARGAPSLESVNR
jgi:hypothetical protein